MSHFHWHITDAQSFPLMVPALPALAEKGAYSTDEIYSVADIQDIVAYAAAVRISLYRSDIC
jgi:hexosaminidase